MKTLRESILRAIREERERQVNKCRHGGDTELFDKSNSQNDWVAYIIAYLGRASAKCSRNKKEGQTFRLNMIKVAALALAALESYELKNC